MDNPQHYQPLSAAITPSPYIPHHGRSPQQLQYQSYAPHTGHHPTASTSSNQRQEEEEEEEEDVEGELDPNQHDSAHSSPRPAQSVACCLTLTVSLTHALGPLPPPTNTRLRLRTKHTHSSPTTTVLKNGNQADLEARETVNPALLQTPPPIRPKHPQTHSIPASTPTRPHPGDRLPKTNSSTSSNGVP